MSQFLVPSWNLKQQGQDFQVDEGNHTAYHVQNNHNPSHAVPMSTDHEVTELTWENGQLSMHGLSNNMIPSPAPNKTRSTWETPADHTLESIVHQATCHQNHNLMNMVQARKPEQPVTCNTGTLRGEKAAEQVQMLASSYNMAKKRTRSETESDQCWRYLGSSSSSRMYDLGAERSACASANATFCRNNNNNSNNNKDTTMMTWGASSFESDPPPSLKSAKTSHDDDSAASHGGGGGGLENKDEEQETRGGTPRTSSVRRNRAAAMHNQSERRRRDRINQKMKALQKLVPNSSKTDKASMLDEVIEYLKQLQAQVNLMSTTAATTIMPQMMMMNPLALQQQLQMSTLLAATAARMGGIHATSNGPPHQNSLQSLIMNSTTSAASLPATPPPFLPPLPFVVPPVIPVSATANGIPTTTSATNNNATVNSASVPLSNPYSALLQAQVQQRENMEFYGKMAALYRQQQANQARRNPILPNFNRGK